MDEAEAPWVPDRPWEVIEVAIALDVSGTMQPLLDAARLSLWEIVNDLSLLQPTPTLRVALLTYGSPRSDPQSGWVRIETDLTQNLDAVSERLFALQTGGDTEYVTRAVLTALQSLSWTDSDEALKLVFVVGNEEADQDPLVDFAQVADLARAQGVAIHPVLCATARGKDAATWQQFARSVQGQLAVLDLESQTLTVETPVDKRLAEMGEALNATFLPLGEEGQARQKAMRREDANATELGTAAAASRAQAKATALYAGDWDLISAVDSGRARLHEVADEELPVEVRGLSAEERQLAVEELRSEREELRRKITELASERRRYLAVQKQAAGIGASQSFESVIRAAIIEQARAKGFELPEE